MICDKHHLINPCPDKANDICGFTLKQQKRKYCGNYKASLQVLILNGLHSISNLMKMKRYRLWVNLKW